jgi:hypothetical protein
VAAVCATQRPTSSTTNAHTKWVGPQRPTLTLSPP